jgi:hypothetical protein
MDSVVITFPEARTGSMKGTKDMKGRSKAINNGLNGWEQITTDRSDPEADVISPSPRASVDCFTAGPIRSDPFDPFNPFSAFALHRSFVPLMSF